MAGLYDELKGKKGASISKKTAMLGGGLYDELAIKTNQPELMSEEFKRQRDILSEKMRNQQIDDERARIYKEMMDDMSTFETVAVATGRGMTTIGRAIGLADDEDEATRKAFEYLQKHRPISTMAGEVLGEAAPFLAAAPLTGAGLATAGGRALIPAAKSLGGRVLGTGLLGAAEGAAIAKGKGGSTNEIISGAGVGGAIGGVSEIMFPIIGRIGRKIFDKLGRRPSGNLLTPDGVPTPEFIRALDEAGTSFDDVTGEAFDFVASQRPGTNPEEVARLARFKSQDIPATLGDISQDFKQQASESRLSSSAVSEAGEPLRQLRLEQSEAFKTQVSDMVDSMGVPDEAGESIKAALQGRKKLLRSEKNALYGQIAEANPEAANIPVMTESIENAIPDKQQLRRLSRLEGSQINAAKELLVEFGIDKSEDAAAAFVKEGGEITPLSMGNFEDFRAAINQIERADRTGAVSVLTGPIKNALDGELDIISDALEQSGDVGSNLVEIAKQARSKVKTIKTEFSPQSITGRLIDVKKDGVSPVIEASKVTKNLLQPSVPIENLQRTIESLVKSGPAGQKALKDMQASVVMNALEAALKSPSRKTSGIETIGGNQFAKSLSNFGDDKLELLFKNDKTALNRLRNLKQTALDINPAGDAVPKGSAPVILDMMRRAGRMPGLAAVVDAVEFVVKAGADDRAVRRAMNAKPEFKQALTALEKDFPTIAASIGIAVAAEEQ